MEYSIHQLSRMAGISTRTLRYYHQIGLLNPLAVHPVQGRIYGLTEVDRLQQIMLFRELDLSLEAIARIMDENSDTLTSLKQHRNALIKKRSRIDRLIELVDATIHHQKGGLEMADKDKFTAFKEKMVQENETLYGREVRERYGEKTVTASYDKVRSMSESQMEEGNRLAREIMDTLKQAMEAADPAGSLAQKAADLHRQWLMHYWPSYSPEAHDGLAQMYVDDSRFTAYYDREIPGTASFLREAIRIYTKQ